MTNAYRDENSVPTKIALLNTNGRTVMRLVADDSTHRLKVNDGITGSNNGPKNAYRDENEIPTLITSSSSDGLSPVALYTDSSGYLLIQST